MMTLLDIINEQPLQVRWLDENERIDLPDFPKGEEVKENDEDRIRRLVTKFQLDRLHHMRVSEVIEVDSEDEIDWERVPPPNEIIYYKIRRPESKRQDTR